MKRRLGASDGDFEADTLATAELGRAAGLLPLLRSLANVNDYVLALSDFHERYDLFLTPTLATPPLEVGSISTPDTLQRLSRVIAKVRAGKLLPMTG